MEDYQCNGKLRRGYPHLFWTLNKDWFSIPYFFHYSTVNLILRCIVILRIERSSERDNEKVESTILLLSSVQPLRVHRFLIPVGDQLSVNFLLRESVYQTFFDLGWFLVHSNLLLEGVSSKVYSRVGPDIK